MVHEITIKRLLEGQFCECNLKRNEIRMGEPVIRRSNPHKWPLTRPPAVNLTAIGTHKFRGELMRSLDTTHHVNVHLVKFYIPLFFILPG